MLSCPETYVVNVPQDQDFESWFTSNAQFYVEEADFIGSVTLGLGTFTGAVGK